MASPWRGLTTQMETREGFNRFLDAVDWPRKRRPLPLYICDCVMHGMRLAFGLFLLAWGEWIAYREMSIEMAIVFLWGWAFLWFMLGRIGLVEKPKRSRYDRTTKEKEKDD